MADVTRNTDKHRFEAHVDGELAGYLDYTAGDGEAIGLPHTVVEEEFAGAGVGGELVQYALDTIRSEGYLVNPVCPFVQDWIEKHPDYADLVRIPDAEGVDGAEEMEEVTGVDPVSDRRI